MASGDGPRRKPRKSSAKPSAWQRRNERAQAAGYRSYYDYRVHDYGRRPPSAPAASGQEKTRLRGHSSQADLLRAMKPGALIGVEGVEHDRKTGKIVAATVLVTDEYGRSKRFVLKGKRQLSQRNLDRLSQAAVDADAVVSPGYGLEQISKAA